MTQKRFEFFNAVLLGALLVGTYGCVTTGDPYADTIFWSSKKADELLADEREALIFERQNENELADRQIALLEEQAAMNARWVQLKESVSEMTEQVRQLQSEIDDDRPDEKKELVELETTVADLKMRINSVSSDADGVNAERERQGALVEEDIVRVRKRLYRLLEGIGE